METLGTEASSLPFLTADLPGVGGVIKRHDEDFLVEEIPRYAPSGAGTHAYLVIEKRGLTTHAAISAIARALGKERRDVGYAGLKDAHGVTRQTLSIEHVERGKIEAMKLAGISVLSLSRHTNKLKLGHLAGNRFVIKVRDAACAASERVHQIVEVLSKRGVPNYFGPQRFGARGDNAAVGRAVLHGNFNEAIALMLGRPGESDRGEARRARELFDAGDLAGAAAAWPRRLPGPGKVCRALIAAKGDTKVAWRAVDHSLRKLYISAVQSELFNRVLAARIESINRLFDGDVAWKHANGACFAVEDAAVEQPRCDDFEISPTGPLFGRKMKEPGGAPRQMEQEVFAASGLTSEQPQAQGVGRMDGARRPLRVPLAEACTDVGTDERGSFVQLSFSLPPGSYATSVTREVCKSER